MTSRYSPILKNVPTMSAHIAQGTSCTRVFKKKTEKIKTHSVYKSLSRSISWARVPALKVAGCKKKTEENS